MTNNFQELIAWQKAHSFVLRVYAITRDNSLAEPI